MEGSNSQPKVFISYSWSSPIHEQWVLDLAERLSGDGIRVVLDKWDLKEGQDKHVFMEQMVNDEKIKKVLVICDQVYQLKADDRKGGVGTETQLISKEVYENINQEKFIPIVKEYVDDKPCIPHHMSSRIYIDLSRYEVFEENYQKLIRNLYDKPLLKRPPLGIPPAYVSDEAQITLRTSHRVLEIKDALVKDKKSANGLISDYLDVFVESLEDYRLSGGSTADFDESVMSMIDKMISLRDNFVDFVQTVFKYQESVDLDKFHHFFEQLITFSYRPESVQSWTDVDYDQYKFFTYELLLYFFATLFSLRKYESVGYFCHEQYFSRNLTNGQFVPVGISIFNQHVRSLDIIRNSRLKLNRVCLTADLLKARALRKDISFEDIKQVDLILYYITELQNSGYGWFPRTSVYNSRGGAIELFDKMISRSHFEKIRKIFDVQDINKLRDIIEGYILRNKDNPRRYSGLWDYDIRPLENVFELKKLGSVK